MHMHQLVLNKIGGTVHIHNYVAIYVRSYVMWPMMLNIYQSRLHCIVARYMHKYSGKLQSLYIS